MAASRKSSKKPPPKDGGDRGTGRGATATVVLILVTLLAVTALPLCVLLLTGIVPTMVAVVVDRHRRKYLTRTVGAMNLAGIAPLALHLWSHGLTLAEAMTMLANPMSWIMMYGAAAIGWGLFLATPPVARVVVDLRADQMRHDLKARAKRLIAEWGEEVAGRAANNPPANR